MIHSLSPDVKLAAVIPVGPGHQEVYEQAVNSVLKATVPPNFTVEPFVVPDEEGLLGRSKARNLGAQAAQKDGFNWLLWLDADDLLDREAFTALACLLDVQWALEAMWGQLWNEKSLRDSSGAICDLRHERSEICKSPLTHFGELVDHGPFGGIHVGNFTKTVLWEKVGGWSERLDLGEDIEFNWACAAHACTFRKIDAPLAKVRIWQASAGGRRGYGKIEPGSDSKTLWRTRAETIWAYWKKRSLLGPDRRWSAEERALRVSDPDRFYGTNFGKWREEPCASA